MELAGLTQVIGERLGEPLRHRIVRIGRNEMLRAALAVPDSEIVVLLALRQLLFPDEVAVLVSEDETCLGIAQGFAQRYRGDVLACAGVLEEALNLVLILRIAARPV